MISKNCIIGRSPYHYIPHCKGISAFFISFIYEDYNSQNVCFRDTNNTLTLKSYRDVSHGRKDLLSIHSVRSFF